MGGEDGRGVAPDGQDDASRKELSLQPSRRGPQQQHKHKHKREEQQQEELGEQAQEQEQEAEQMEDSPLRQGRGGQSGGDDGERRTRTPLVAA